MPHKCVPVVRSPRSLCAVHSAREKVWRHLALLLFRATDRVLLLQCMSSKPIWSVKDRQSAMQVSQYSLFVPRTVRGNSGHATYMNLPSSVH